MANIHNVISDALERVNLGNFETEVRQNGAFYRIKFSKDSGKRFVFAEIMAEDGYVLASLGRRKGICREDCERIMDALMDQYSSRESDEVGTDSESGTSTGGSTH